VIILYEVGTEETMALFHQNHDGLYSKLPIMCSSENSFPEVSTKNVSYNLEGTSDKEFSSNEE